MCRSICVLDEELLQHTLNSFTQTTSVMIEHCYKHIIKQKYKNILICHHDYYNSNMTQTDPISTANVNTGWFMFVCLSFSISCISPSSQGDHNQVMPT